MQVTGNCTKGNMAPFVERNAVFQVKLIDVVSSVSYRDSDIPKGRTVALSSASLCHTLSPSLTT